MAQIETLITQTEKHRSIFEECIRKLDVPVCAAFKDGAGVAPVTFQAGAEAISTKDTPAVNGGAEHASRDGRTEDQKEQGQCRRLLSESMLMVSKV